jgi:hypothetical protein
MYSPLARITPTRLPWSWIVGTMWLLLAALTPVLAAEAERAPPASDDADAADVAPPLSGWRWVPLDHALRLSLQSRRTGPRLFPLAVLPMRRSAWWFGLGASRSSGARVELRWTMPLDGNAPRTAIVDTAE